MERLFEKRAGLEEESPRLGKARSRREVPTPSPRQIPVLCARLPQPVGELPRFLEEHPPDGSKAHFLGTALKQYHAEFILQIADLPAKRRLGNIEAHRRLRDVQLLGDGNEVTKMAQFHLSRIILKRYREPSNMIFFRAQARTYDLLMNILSHSAIPVYSLPGLQHQTIASKSDGTHAMEAWKQALAPGAATPPHFHECEEVIYILQGMGEIAIEGETVPFAADCTLILPPLQVHQITNTGLRRCG